MKFKTHAIAVVSFALACVPASLVAQGPPPPPPGYYAGGQGWDEPPSEYQEVGRRAFHDGVEGARKDYENHRRPDYNNRDEYRHPNVPGRDRAEYRDAFRRGYAASMQHLAKGESR